MNSAAIVYDCEFLTNATSPRRFWCGPSDPDPVIAQIGAARLDLTGTFEISGTFSAYVAPVDRHGAPYALDPFFTHLTGITDQDIATKGQTLETALRAVDEFSRGTKFWSWGKDEFNMIAISCYVAGIPAIIPAPRFDNACKLIRKAGMPAEDMNQVRSNTLADYYKIDHPPLRGHDALGDALSVAYALQHLLRNGSLAAADLA